ncbi:hypothetical protein [Micromonospora sp. NBC_01412]|uniref:hypothetical protein n=1 Tax=Micromonospora sp. NBC_01412 TaxID=2903590 RepID=UPI00324BF740
MLIYYLDLGRQFSQVEGWFRRDAEMVQRVSSFVVLDPEHGPVASLVFAGPDDVFAAPSSGLPGEQPTELQGVGQAAVVSGDELPIPRVVGVAAELQRGRRPGVMSCPAERRRSS